MTATSYAILALGVLLELCLVLRLFWTGLWRQYVYFLTYVVCVVTRTIALVGVIGFAPAVFRDLYWETETISTLFRFLVIWEVYRHAFPGGLDLSSPTAKKFLFAASGLVMLPVAMFWRADGYNNSISTYLALERSFGYLQAVLLLGILFVARYFGIEFGRNLWGVAVAFGGYVSALTANDAMIVLRHSYLPYWQVLSPVAFIAMLGAWLWAIWIPEANSSIAADGGQTAELDWWEDNWDRTITTVRRIVRS